MPRIPRSLLVVLLGAGLLLPLLGDYGLWDPLEIRIADVAQEVGHTGKFSDVTVAGRYAERPVLNVWLIAMGFKLFGVNELAGRLPLALCGLLTLLIAYRAFSRLLNPNAALIGAFVLVTTPTFLFQSRQLVSDVPYYLSIVAAIGGLAAFIWPARGARSRLDLAIGCAGLYLGFLAKGVVLGAGLPLAATVVAVALSWRSLNSTDPDGVWPQATDNRLGQNVGDAVIKSALPLIIGILLTGIAIVGSLILLKNGPFMVMGAIYNKQQIPPTFEMPLKELGFGFYPWVALLPIALAYFVMQQRRELGPATFGAASADDAAVAASGGPAHGTEQVLQARFAFVGMLFLCAIVGSYVVAAIWPAYFEKLRYPALPLAAFAVGALLYHLSQQHEKPHRLLGLIAAGMILAIHQDFVMEPQTLAFAHITESATYPSELSIKTPIRILGALQLLVMFLALGGTPNPIGTFSRRSDLLGLGRVVRLFYVVWYPVRDGIAWLLRIIELGIRFIAGGLRGVYFFYGMFAVAFAFALFCAFYVTPQMSLHMSNKALYEVYHRCKGKEERLAQYQVSGRGAAYYNNGQVDVVASQTALFDQLKQKNRRFILIPSAYLAPIDQEARRTNVPYFVLDDRSSQYLLVTNQLTAACNEDRNPLRRFVQSKAPTPRHKLMANFENQVKLIGYDVDDVVTRGGKFPMTLYFQVLGQVPAGYEIFIHIDQPASRIIGDHVPVEGKYPTQYWLPGDYITDTYKIDIPLLTTTPGPYTIYAGFWRRNAPRLKVIEGPNDGVHRVRLGTMTVR